jgi:PAS domain-containing protein
METSKFRSIEYGRYSMEMRSGKILKMDEGFNKIFGYTEEDIKEGLVFKQFVPNVEYADIIKEMRQRFIDNVFTCYEHEMLTKSGKKLKVVSFVTIQNKLLEGHRVLEVGVALPGVYKD